MEIGGTSLTAMARDDQNGYGLNAACIPANGKGDLSFDAGMYHVWMMDGALAGASFDGAIDVTTDRKTGSIALPVLSTDNINTVANEFRTHLILAGSAVDDNEGVFSMGDLLGSGMATDEGSRFLEDAADTIGRIRSDVAAQTAMAMLARRGRRAAARGCARRRTTPGLGFPPKRSGRPRTRRLGRPCGHRRRPPSR